VVAVEENAAAAERFGDHHVNADFFSFVRFGVAVIPVTRQFAPTYWIA
jgi:hypothetical protein